MAQRAGGDSLEAARQIGRSWWVVLIFGLITVAMGIVITFHPGGTVRVLAILVGIWLLVLGIFKIVSAIGESGESGGSRFGTALMGLLAVLIGLLVLHHSFETVAIVGFIVGVFWVVGGLAELFSGFTHEAEGHRAGRIVLGLVGTVIGILCLVYPGLSLSILAVLLGIGILIYGIVEIVLAFQIRKLAQV
jgi:uncharacterized membrane protein HdeD (DUF308 family)